MSTQNTLTCESQLVDKLRWRYATKKFDSNKKIKSEVWNQIEEALLLTPSSFGLQPWTFVVVTNPELKSKLPQFSWNQQQPQECSHLVVFARPDKIDEAYVANYIERIAEVRGVSADSLSTYKKMMTDFVKGATEEKLAEWMSRQCYIALGNLMTVAAAVGLDACPMEGFSSPDYDRILGLTEKGLRSVVVCPLGYRAEDDKYAQAAKVRFPKEKVILHI
ncbi:MAG: NAD(P)H-dependent oxidoreductase [Candidatus Obscuribacterales bacterium]|nr:NAD(P)H-dependent oxidoreductase [Candidatus Obscuribacterales bacterium]